MAPSLETHLRRLSKIYAPSKNERKSAEYLEQAMNDFVDESSIDGMNN